MLDPELKNLMTELKLNNLKDNLEGCLLSAEQEEVTYLQFLKNALNLEYKTREEKKYRERARRSNLPYFKDFSDYDFNFQNVVSKRKINALCEMEWVDRLFNMIFLGPPGVGKTRIMVSVGVEALKRGYTVFFITMSDLMEVLNYRSESRKLENKYKKILNCQILLLDEVGYQPINKDEANKFFNLIAKLHEKTSIMITSNKKITEWSEFVDDVALATAVLDRLSFRCETFSMSGNSYRLENRERFFTGEV